MTYEPLHHKYRPQTFAALVGQTAIATTLTNALRQERIAPAYLFTGPRGTGKTSSARILAKSLNCLSSSHPTAEPCGGCEVCRGINNGSVLDVIEIDAASNTGVDNIRELIERAQFAPVQCRYKVYVIDECHMLSTSAFNALLKTLEEPPNRVVFVLATTDPQRVLPTIISRCQRFDFRRIPLAEMVAHLKDIASKEAIEIAPDALNLVAQLAQGGLRDAESLLDQLSLLSGEITLARVWDLVGAVPEQDLLQLLEAIAVNHPEAVLEQTRQLLERGREPLVLLQNLASFYRDLLIAKTAPGRQDLVAITPLTWEKLCAFAEKIELSTILLGQQHLRTCEAQVKNSTQPRLWLEVSLLGLLPASLPTGIQTASSQPTPPLTAPATALRSPAPSHSQRPPTATSSAPAAPEPSLPSLPAAQIPKREEDTAPKSLAAGDLRDTPPSEPSPSRETPAVNLEQLWQQVLQQLQPPGTQSLLRQHARLLGFTHREARVGIKTQPLFKMAQERLPNVEAAFEATLGHSVRVRLEVAPTQEPPPLPPGASTPPPQKTGPVIPGAGTVRPSVPPLPTPPPTSAATIPPETVPPPEPPLPEPPLLVAPPWQEVDELTKIARSFAQFFNGVVVDSEPSLDSSITNPEELAKSVATPTEVEEAEPSDAAEPDGSTIELEPDMPF